MPVLCVDYTRLKDRAHTKNRCFFENKTNTLSTDRQTDRLTER